MLPLTEWLRSFGDSIANARIYVHLLEIVNCAERSNSHRYLHTYMDAYLHICTSTVSVCDVRIWDVCILYGL